MEDPRQQKHLVIRRIFIAQLVLILVLSGLATALRWYDFGSFWFAFLVGCLGGTVGLLRRVRAGLQSAIDEASLSWWSTLMPALYGGLMAGVAYLLFMSRILSGDPTEGLFTSNLFPLFSEPEGDGPLSLRVFIDMRPVELTDLGKLLVWSFIAGYSESFVTGMLERLEQGAGQDAPPASERGSESPED